MTREDYAKLTEEEKRIKVAELCGYHNVQRYFFDLENRNDLGGKLTKKRTVSPVLIPDYLNDLNAMHEAEKVMTPDQMSVYVSRLAFICLHDAMEDSAFATAAQRAEAFVLTMTA